MRGLIRTLKVLVLLTVVLCAILFAFLQFAPTFGARPEGASLNRIEASPNYADGKFVNLVPTKLDTSTPDSPRNLAGFFFPPDDKNPVKPLPSKRFDVDQLTPGRFVWLGHSTVIFNTGDLIIAADPIFYRASPVPFIGRPFPITNPTSTSDLPDIDVVIISHDHYDHLDHRSIGELRNKTARFLVPLGLSGHLMRWGVQEQKITELDWYEHITIEGVDFTLTPSRHFSGRTLTDRSSTLWGSWAIKSPKLNVFFSGDSGYFGEFKKIGDRYGPFDIAFVENGAYDNGWNQIHMTPEQAVQTSRDLNARLFFPIHWSKFDLALHPWTEPVERAKKAATAEDVNMVTPEIGEVFDLEQPPTTAWWDSSKAN